MTHEALILLLLLHAHNSQIIRVELFQAFLQRKGKGQPAQLIGVAPLPKVDDHFDLFLDFLVLFILLSLTINPRD